MVEAIFENLKTNPDKLEPALKYAKRLHGTAATRLHVLILNIRGDSPVDLMTAALSRESLEEFESSARAVENALRAEQQSRDFLKHVRGWEDTEVGYAKRHEQVDKPRWLAESVDELVSLALEQPGNTAAPRESRLDEIVVVEKMYEQLKANPSKVTNALIYAQNLSEPARSRLHVLILGAEETPPMELISEALMSPMRWSIDQTIGRLRHAQDPNAWRWTNVVLPKGNILSNSTPELVKKKRAR